MSIILTETSKALWISIVHVGLVSLPAAVPIATPPASVEFCTCTILNLLSLETRAEVAKARTQLVAIESNVFIIALCWSSPLSAALLNDGQKSQRNIVPKILKMYHYSLRIISILEIDADNWYKIYKFTNLSKFYKFWIFFLVFISQFTLIFLVQIT